MWKTRVLVCGGAGFLGSHLCDRLLEKGHQVLCVDNFHTGLIRNIRHLLDRPDFELMRHDVIDPLDVDVDQIYNLACPASPIHYQRNPIQTIKTSVLGTINLLELAERLHVRLVQASTSEVYGQPEQHPQSEDYCGHVNFIGPRACYDEGKRCAETMIFDYRRHGRVDGRVARIFNTYGPRMHHADGRVVCSFIVSALRNEPLTIYGDGCQTRSFCYVDDLIDGLMRLMAHDGDASEPINLGNPNEMTILELAERVITITGSRSKIVRQSLPQDDPIRRKPDITRAERILGWKPMTSLDDGLAAMVAYFEAQLGLRTVWAAPVRDVA
jgi:UDP-glucuronate decarboxylase